MTSDEWEGGWWRGIGGGGMTKAKIVRKNGLNWAVEGGRFTCDVIRNQMSVEDLKKRFKKFAIDVATLLQGLPRNSINYAYANQLVRSSSSSAANYRAACRAKSTADFINKLTTVEEELDESIFFLEMLSHFNEPLDEQFRPNVKEGNELLAITVASIKTARRYKK